jgi:hypothetical protein
MDHMDRESGDQGVHHDELVELTRVQPFEAEVIAARLRSSGIPATAGADSVYPSVSFADGVPVFVAAADAPRARALLEDNAEPDEPDEPGPHPANRQPRQS